MDGEALLAAFGTHPGPDCLRDVLPKFGQRIKVYNCLKGALREAIRLQVSSYHLSVVSPTCRYCVNLVCNYLHYRIRFPLLEIGVL